MSLMALSSKPSQQGVSRYRGSFRAFKVHHSVSQFIMKVLNIHFTIQSAILCVNQMFIPSTWCPYNINTQGLLLFLHYLFCQFSALPLFHTDQNSDGIFHESTLTALVCWGCCSEVTYAGWHKWLIHIFTRLQWLSPWPRCQQNWLRPLSFASMGLAFWCLVSNTLLQCSGCTSFEHCDLWSYRFLQGDEYAKRVDLPIPSPWRLAYTVIVSFSSVLLHRFNCLLTKRLRASLEFCFHFSFSPLNIYTYLNPQIWKSYILCKERRQA